MVLKNEMDKKIEKLLCNICKFLYIKLRVGHAVKNNNAFYSNRYEDIYICEVIA